MKKDVIIAITAGFISGILVALFIINLPSFLNFLKLSVSSQNTQLSSESESITPTIALEKAVLNLRIDSPANNSISEQKQIEIKGKAKSAKTIVIEYSKEIKIAQTDSDGDFSLKIDLAEGGNDIYVSAYTEQGEVESQILTVFYTTEKL